MWLTIPTMEARIVEEIPIKAILSVGCCALVQSISQMHDDSLAVTP